MEIKSLSVVPGAINRIAGWYFSEWGHFSPAQSQENIAQSLSDYLPDEGLPQALVALENGEPIGVAQIKFHELSLYPQHVHWLGGVFVKPEYRGKSVGTELVQNAMNLARRCGVEEIYLQTLRLDGGLYGLLGWERIEEFEHKNFTKLLMVYRW